ncbi:MAG: sigma-54 dependent transcriptional regulator [Desulfobacteraceae bacterium]
MNNERILIIDDENVLRRSLAMDFTDEGFNVCTAESGETGVVIAADFKPRVVLLDLRLPGMDGIQVLEILRRQDEELVVIMMTAYGDTQTTVEAIKRGAVNFINKPFELDEIKALVRQAIQNQNRNREFEYLKYQQRRFYRFCDLVGESPQMRAVYRQIETLADTEDVTILIRGESGTGKELVASAIHYKSARRKAPFTEINCASLPETLLESELFGYEKGAFTDAKQSKKGLFELSDNGTIFLDEIGEMPIPLQAKLLRFLEKKQFKRLGSGKDLQVDARIIAATNRDLEGAIREGQFRSDLYYRLNVVTLHLPPLRNRRDDILLLADFFIDRFCKDMGKSAKKLTDEVKTVLQHHPWEGNVRELRNVIERAVIFSKGESIGIDLMPPEVVGRRTETDSRFPLQKIWEPGDAIETAICRVESQIIEEALKRCGHNKTKAAEMMGISRFALGRRLERLEKQNTNQCQ